MGKYLILILALLFQISLAEETILGISPGLIDLQTVERGEEKLLTFSVISITHSKILVSLSSNNGNINYFSAKYPDRVQNFSEEETKDWVKIINNPAELEPISEEIRLKRGLVKGAREINFILKVPENAEPGYHLVKVLPIPVRRTSPEIASGIGIDVVTTAELSVVFFIPGEAIRNGKVVDVIFNNYNGRYLNGKVLFKNLGTVTIKAKLDYVKIFYNGTEIANATGTESFFKPNQMGYLNFGIDASNLNEDKEYDVIAKVSFSTGSDEIFVKSKIPRREKLTGLAVKVGINYLYLLFFIFALIISFIIYKKSRK
ncbi:MAG: hypothetical protein QW641_00715 [Candidatus Aenigmatarchaeota archaeon]